MPDLPSGTVTFLFTDIEGSTRRWDAQRAAMSGALARHDELLRAAIERHGGHVFKTVGDAFCAAFGSAADGLAAAVAAQRALAAEDWSVFATGSSADAGSDLDADRATDFAMLRVRMALHTGQAEQRDGDYFGPPLNRVARLLSTGHGGQVLLSLITEELVRDDLPAGAGLRDLGEHRLKDLFRPEQVFQLVAPGLAPDFPALKTLGSRPNNLPVQPTSMVGREDEVVRIRQRLAGTRLLTLTGVGGTGKTRLALQVAADVLDEYPDGVWFVDLAPIVNPGLVAQTAAAALGIGEQPGRTIEATLLDHFRSKQALIVLDNCEHLVAACAGLADRLVRAAPRVRVLATSRETLAVPGEAVWTVPPLGVPAADRSGAGVLDLHAMTAYAAVRLFIERAVAVKPDFAVTNINAPAVAGICQRLDGIPLAIELAAARAKHMAPDQILARLDQRFRLLTGGGRTVLPRQQTLEAAIDWSHGLLDEAEQTLFRRLSVFRGGWTLEAAEAVGGAGPLEDWEVVDLLGRLVDKSLAVVDDAGGDAVRFRFLETVREYARDKLIAAGEREQFRGRHVAHFCAFAEIHGAALTSPDQSTPLSRLAADHDNLRAALERALTGGDVAGSLRLGASLWRFWGFRGYFTEARSWFERIVRQVEERPPEAELHLPWAMAMWGLAYCVGPFGAGDPAAFALYEQALERFRAIGDRQGESWCLNDMGAFSLLDNDLAQSEALFSESLAHKYALGDPRDIAISLHNLAEVALERGGGDRAEAMLKEALALLPDDPWSYQNERTLNRLGMGDVCFERNNLTGAREAYAQALDLAASMQHPHYCAEVIDRFGWLAAHARAWIRSARLLGASDAIFAAIGMAGSSYLIPHRRRPEAEAAVRAALGDAAFDAAYAEGRAMNLGEAVAYVPEDA